jgi:hypothetical protein
MATLFVRHSVKDFGAWKAAYDAFDAERQTMGVKGHGVFQVDGSANEVTVYHEFDNMDSAKSFVDSPRLKEVMEAAGVVGAPDMWFANRV